MLLKWSAYYKVVMRFRDLGCMQQHSWHRRLCHSLIRSELFSSIVKRESSIEEAFIDDLRLTIQVQQYKSATQR